MIRRLSRTQKLVWSLVLGSVLFAPSCKCGANLLNGGGEFGGLDNYDERFTAYRGAAGSTVTVCPGQSTLLGSLDFSDITYSWDPIAFLDDPTSARPTFTSTQPGNYIYTLTITDGQGRSVTSGVTAIVVPPPSPIIESDRPTVCAGGSLDFTGAGSFAAKGQTITGYAWDFNGDGTTDSTEANPSARAFPDIGNFPVSLTVTDSLGCSGTDTHTYSICDAPTATFSVVQQKVGESAGTVFINVNLDAPAPADIHIPIAFSGSAASADYTGPTEIVVPAGTTMGTAQISIIDDVVNEDDETIVITLITGGGAKPGTAATHTITIADNDLLPVIIINDLAVDEGVGTLTYTVTLSEPSGRLVTVNYGTAASTADCADVTNATGTLTFQPGETTKQITLAVVDDALDEDDEIIFATLSGAVNASLLDTHAVGTGEQFGGRTPDTVYGIGTISDNDALPTLSIADRMVTEQNPPPAVTVSADFDVALDVPSGRSVSLTYSTSSVNATNGVDYIGASATFVVFQPATHALVGNVCTQTAPATTNIVVQIPIINNTTAEGTETFTVDLSGEVNATVASSVGVGTILDDDPKPVATASSPYAAQASGVLTFAVSLSTVSEETISVDYSTLDGTALGGPGGTSGANYVTTTGTLTFPPGTRTLPVDVLLPATTSPDTFLFLSLSNPVAARVQSDQCFVGTILERNGAPRFSITDVIVSEASNTAVFTVYRSGSTAAPATVSFATADASAKNNIHYAEVITTLSFAIGEAAKTVNVPVADDNAPNPSLSFFANLSAPLGATLSRARGTATIIDNDQPPAPPAINARDGFVLENWGLACVTITRSGVNTLGSSATYTTRDGTAISAPSGATLADYTSRTGTLFFDPLEAVKTIGIPILHDLGQEPPEHFFFDLTAPSGSTLATPTAKVTILDTDGNPTFVITDATVLENDGIAQITVSLTGSHVSDVSINYSTSNGTAVAGATGPTGADYTSSSGTLVFTITDFSQVIDIPINDDAIFELSETFTVGITGATGLPSIVVADASGTVTINDDDAAPVFTVANISHDENGTLDFGITLSKQSQVPLSINYATANGTAIAGATGPTGADYTSRSGTALFAPYETLKTISVAINDDLVDENDETLSFTLSAPTAPATIGVGSATGTILDNDLPPAISVSSPTVVEGAGPLSFVFTLPLPSAKTITVAYATTNGSAIAGLDYTTSAGTVTFAPGIVSQTVTVPVANDAIYENTETLSLDLSSPTNASLVALFATGTITEGGAKPVLSINNVSFAEADGAATSFTVSLSRAASFAVTVDFASANGSAIAGPTGDYLATSGTLTFAAGDTSKPISVTIVNDSTDEANETFTVALSNQAPLADITLPGSTYGTGTIVDDDPAPSLSIANVSGAEGASGSTGTFGFVVTLGQASGQAVTVEYRTVAGTATAASDFVATSGTLSFAPGETSKIANVSVMGDNLDEPDESFTVILCTGAATPIASCVAAPSNATIAGGTGTGTIQNDDTAPTISIADRLNLPEGNSGTSPQTFTVTLSKPSGRTVTVAYATTDGTALAGSDYDSATGTLTFNPGQVSQTFTVQIRGDAIDEDVETFDVTLANPTNASLLDGLASASIANDDTPPTISIADFTLAPEGSAGFTNATLTITLSAQSGKPITVSYITQNGTAVSSSDYTATGPLVVTFAPGITTQQVTVPVFGDTLNELNETFRVRLCSDVNLPAAGCTNDLTNATILDDDALVTITDDDAEPALNIGDITLAEGPSGSTVAFNFTVNLSTASGRNVTFNAVTVNGVAPDASAIAPTDYLAYGPTGLTIPAGSLSATIAVTVNGDALDENDETFSVALSGVVGATGGNRTGVGTITNDDVLPQISVNDVSLPEASGGNFAVSLNTASGRIVRVSYSSSSGTAISGTDFTGLTTTVLTFNPGQTSLNVPVTVTNDVLDEDNETFSFNLSAPQNATISDGLGVGTIVDDDAVPTLAVGDVTTAEGTLGLGACTGSVTSTPFNFLVTMSPTTGSGRPVTVDYATANGPTGVTGALAGSDYTAATGTVTFPVGSTGQVVTVQVGCDSIYEANQQFYLNLANALTGVSGTVVSIADTQGLGTITNDDNAPTVSLDTSAAAVPEGAAIVLTATLSQPSEVAATIPFDVRQTTGNEPIYAHSVASGDYYVTQCTGFSAGPPSVPTGCSLSIPAGSTTASINLSARSDASPDDGEDFTIRLCTASAMPVASCTAPTAATPASPAIAAVTITDNQLPVVTVTSAAQSVNENVGTVTVTVSLDVLPSAGRPVTVPFSVSGTALSGASLDYVQNIASPLPLFGSTGSLTQNITFTIYNDALNEAAETIIVSLGAPTNGTLGSPTVHTITINPDAADVAPSISINTTSINEPDSGTAPGTLTVSLSQPSGQIVSVQYLSIDGPSGATGAVTPADYTSVALSTLTFPVGVTGLTVPITVAGDLLDENNETFAVILSAPVNASITAPTGTVTINDNDATPVLSIDSVSVNEPDTSATVVAGFTVTLTPVSGRPVNVNYATANGPTGATGAVAPADYTALGSTLVTFAPGEITKSVNVTVNGDVLDENDEIFYALLSAPANATIVAPTGTATIVDNDALPQVSVADAPAVLENAGNMSFVVSLNQPSGRVVTVLYTTTSGTASLGPDFTGPVGTTGTVTFAVGVTGQTVLVPVNDDNFDELQETMSFNLVSVTNGQLNDALAIGTINDNDNNSMLAIAPTGTTEGANGTTKQLSFAVTLSQASQRTVTVTATPSSGGTATANTDYAASAGVVTFNPGEVSKVFDVTINGDDLDEDNETFTVTLSGQSGAGGITTPTAIGTITDDDATPTIAINDPAAIAEGNSGTTALVFTVTLSTISGRDVRFTYVTADGTALVSDGDYGAAGPTGLTITAGTTTRTISINVTGDTRHESNETLLVNLSAAQTGAANDPVTIADNSGTGTINNDDNPPDLCVADVNTTNVLTPVAGAEGNAASTGAKTMTFTVRLTPPGSNCTGTQSSGLTVGVSYSSANITAVAGSDYALGAGGVTGTLSFAPGTTSQTFTVPITSDALNEDDETFNINLSAPSNASFGRSVAVGTITNDDAVPTLSINTPAAVAEGNAGGTQTIIFTVSLNTASGKDVTVDYATANATATTADNDYVGKSGSVIIAAGSLSTTISVQLTGDVRYEPDQTFTMNLSNPQFATITTAQGTGTIQNDDATPTIGVSAVTLTEGNSGTSNMVFTVNVLTGVPGVPITFNYATSNGTAVAPGDYTAVGPTGLTIAADTASTTFSVPIVGDTLWENANETFTATISGAANASITSASATGTITDDDAAPTVSLSYLLVAVCEGTNPGIGGCQNDAGGPFSPAPSQQVQVSAGLSFSGSTTATAVAINVPYTLSGATGDYTIAPASFSIPAGSTTSLVTLTISDDSTPESIETTTLTLGTPAPAAVLTSAPTSYMLTIHDNDQGVQALTATTLDTNQDGHIDLIKVVFELPVQDSTFPGYAVDGGATTADWFIGGAAPTGYTNVSIAHGTSLTALGIADTTDDDTIYLRFTPKVIGDTGARPTLSTTATPGLRPVGSPTTQVTVNNLVPLDGAAPIILTATAESGKYDLLVTFSEPVQTSGSDSTCTSPADDINTAFDLDYEDPISGGIGSGNATDITGTAGISGAAVDLNGCDASILVKSTPSPVAATDINHDTLRALGATSIYDLATTPNAMPTTRVPITGIIHPTLDLAFSIGQNFVQIEFSDPMSVAGGAGGASSALNYANYSLADNAVVQGNTACHTGAALAFDTSIPIQQSPSDPKVFILATTAQQSCVYQISANNPSDLIAGTGLISTTSASLAENIETFTGNEGFRLIGAQAVSATSFTLEFNRPYLTTGPSGALNVNKYLLPYSLSPAGSAGPTGPLAVTGVVGSPRFVLITHERAQCADLYPIRAANNNNSDSFADAGRTIQSATTPPLNMSANPGDLVYLKGFGTELCGPLLFDPFLDQSSFGSLADYKSNVYIGPNKNGDLAAHFPYTATTAAQSTFLIARDNNSVNDTSLGVSKSRNAGVVAATGSTYVTFGHSNCTEDSANKDIGCGPDNEDGRGVFGVANLFSNPFLLVGSVRTKAQFHYLYMTDGTSNTLNFNYIDANTGGGVFGGITQGLSAIQSLNNRLFAGMARSDRRRPDFSKISYDPTDFVCPNPPLKCDVPTSAAPRLYMNAMDYFGRCGNSPNGSGTGPSSGNSFCTGSGSPTSGANGTPRTPNGAWFGGVDSLYTPPAGSNMAAVLYAGNGGHPALRRDGAIVRSLTDNPAPCRDYGRFDGCTTNHPSGTQQWVDITPGRAIATTGPTGNTGYLGAWYIGGLTGATGATAGTGRHFSIELGKVADFVPGDRAFPQWTSFGPSGNIYVGRNVCRAPVGPSGWVVPNDNTNVYADTASDLDWSSAKRGDARHSTDLWDGCMMNMLYCTGGTNNNTSCDDNSDCTGGGTCRAVMQSATETGDSKRRAQLWKCTPSGVAPNRVCNASDWSLIDGGGAGLLSDSYTSFGDPTTNGNRTISMTIANGSYLYVGFDNPTTGLQIWRTLNSNPTDESGWEQVGISGLTDQNLQPDAAHQWQIYSAISVQQSGVFYLYFAAGRPGWPVSIYSLQNN